MEGPRKAHEISGTEPHGYHKAEIEAAQHSLREEASSSTSASSSSSSSSFGAEKEKKSAYGRADRKGRKKGKAAASAFASTGRKAAGAGSAATAAAASSSASSSAALLPPPPSNFGGPKEIGLTFLEHVEMQRALRRPLAVCESADGYRAAMRASGVLLDGGNRAKEGGFVAYYEGKSTAGELYEDARALGVSSIVILFAYDFENNHGICGSLDVKEQEIHFDTVNIPMFDMTYFVTRWAAWTTWSAGS